MGRGAIPMFMVAFTGTPRRSHGGATIRMARFTNEHAGLLHSYPRAASQGH